MVYVAHKGLPRRTNSGKDLQNKASGIASNLQYDEIQRRF